MSIQVKSIDVYKIEARLKKDTSKDGVETWGYVKALKESYARQGDLVKIAMKKVRELSAQITNPSNQSHE